MFARTRQEYKLNFFLIILNVNYLLNIRKTSQNALIIFASSVDSSAILLLLFVVVVLSGVHLDT